MTAVYTNESNPHALKLLVGANFSKRNLDLKIVNLNDRTLQEPRHLPYLEVDSENSIFISNAALNFLVPSTQDDANERKINELLELESIMLSPSLAMAIGSATNKNDRIFSGIVSYLEKLNKVLESKPNLVDDGISTGDIAIWSTLYPLSKDDSLSKEYLSNFANLSQWLKKLADIPEFKDAINKFPIQSGAASYQALYNGAKYLSATNMVAAPSGDSSHKSSPQHQAEKSELITPQELIDAEKAWKRDPKEIPKLKPHQKVVLPTPGEKNILITSALPYVNNVPHLGNIIGCVLSADVFARFARLCNWNTAYIGGTDEYGTATETKALEEGLTCRQICDKYYAVHNDIYKWFNISFDYFGRTSDPEQTELCQDMFLQLNSNGFMFIDSVEQLHCERCDRYLADRFVEGGCPHVGCNYEDARGDQCDGCGKLVNAVDLKNPRCKICSSSPKLKISKQFYMDLPKLEPLILHWIKKSSGGWSHNAQVIAKSWLKEGLKPRCITRDLKWGVPVPLEEFKNKVFYVWFDAPIGYMSISKAYTEKWEQWWRPQNGTEVTLYQFMAKDNVPFHSVMFPATLLGANRGYITVSHIMATEYLNYEDGKFSKSRGVGVFGNDARDTGIPSDVWRFYLLYLRPESQDSSFSWADLATKNNSELLNNLGNFINRALVFAKNNFNRTVPAMKLTQDDYSFLVLCTRELRGYVTCLEKCKLRDGIRHILSISRHGNQYMQSNQPWVLLKGTDEEKLRAGTVIGVCCNIACLLSALLNPYLPETSVVLKKQLNAPDAALNPENPDIAQLLPSGHKLGEPSPLFAKLEQSRVEELKQRFAGKQGENNNTNSAAPNNAKKPNKHAVTNNSIPLANDVTKVDVESIESEVCKQADKVRALKSSGVEKKMWQPEVDVLLALKKKLEAAQKLVQNKVDTSKPTSNGLANGNSVPVAAGDDVETLEEAVSRQGLVVRKLKEGGADKSVWQPEVTKLLELKARLAKISGKPQAEPQKNKKSSKKIGA